MQIIKHTVETKASPEEIWQIWQDVKNWNSWDHGIEHSSIDGPFAEGTTGSLKPKGGPLVRTKLTCVEPCKKFVDESKLFLARIIVSHDVREVGGKTLVTHHIEMKGPLAFLFAKVIGRTMKKNLPQEMEAMVKKAESLRLAENGETKKVEWKAVTRFDGPEQSPGFLLWQVSTVWRRKVEAALSTLGLTHAQFVILASVGWLTREDGQITQIALARHCGTDVTMTSQILRTLERNGYIMRTQNKGDERSKCPQITPKGAKVIEQAIPLVETVDHEFFAKINERTNHFVETLQRLSN